MKEYIEREAAISACYDGYADNRDDCAENIRMLPAADVVAVVRCKDCTHSFIRGGNMMCEKHRYTWNNLERWVNDDDFCCWGVRKDGDGE